MRRLCAAVIAAAVVLGVVAAPAGAAKAPKGCLAALDASKQLQIHLLLEATVQDDVQHDIVAALTGTNDFTAALSNVTDVVAKAGRDRTAVRPIYDDLKDEYDAAAKRCRAGK